MALMDKVMDSAIVLLVVGALTPTIADFTIGISGTGNVTGITAAVLPLTIALLILGVMVGIYRYIVARQG